MSVRPRVVGGGGGEQCKYNLCLVIMQHILDINAVFSGAYDIISCMLKMVAPKMKPKPIPLLSRKVLDGSSIVLNDYEWLLTAVLFT